MSTSLLPEEPPSGNPIAGCVIIAPLALLLWGVAIIILLQIIR